MALPEALYEHYATPMKTPTDQRYYGFFGFFALFALPGLLNGEWGQAVWLVWVVWFLFFSKVGRRTRMVRHGRRSPVKSRQVERDVPLYLLH